MTLSGPVLTPLSGQNPKSMVIFLHGVGANGDDLITIGREWQKDLPETVFLSPNAPEKYDMAPVGYQWFSLAERDFDFIHKGVKSAHEKLNQFIDDSLKKYKLTADKLFIVGFSQGTMMALYTMPRRPDGCRALVGYSGMTIDDASLQTEAVSKPPIKLIHGQLDEVVPIQAMTATEACLKSCDFDVESETRPQLGHSIDMHGLIAGLTFIKKKADI